MSITTTSPGLDLSFALPHAIHLAEAATSVQDKRIGTSKSVHECAMLTVCVGYLFCVEIMPSRHPLQLLLVNTLRKVVDSFVVRVINFHRILGSRKPFSRTNLLGIRDYDTVALRRSYPCSADSSIRLITSYLVSMYSLYSIWHDLLISILIEVYMFESALF
jgi:hypothetical protein